MAATMSVSNANDRNKEKKSELAHSSYTHRTTKHVENSSLSWIFASYRLLLPVTATLIRGLFGANVWENGEKKEENKWKIPLFFQCVLSFLSCSLSQNCGLLLELL